MARARVTFEVDDMDMKRVKGKFERASGKSLYVHLQRATLAQGDLILRRMRSEVPRGPTGNLRRSLKVRPVRQNNRSTTGVLVGPVAKIAPHRHLVIRGTKERSSIGPRSSSAWRVLPGSAALGQTTRRGGTISGVNVRRAGTFTTGRMKANPFVDRAAAGFERKAADAVMREWTSLLR